MGIEIKDSAGKGTPKGDKPSIYFVNKIAAGPAATFGLPQRKRTQKASGDVIQSEAREIEDDFSKFTDLRGDKGTIQPPFDFRDLEQLVWKNNVLPSLVDAMEASIDGTGAELIPVETDEIDPAGEADAEEMEEESRKERDKKKAGLQAFFDEPFPGISMLTMRRRLRRDLENIGNGYFEGMRNAKDELVFLRHVVARTIRLVRLDNALPVTVTVVRAGQEMPVTIMMRERRYVQIVGGKPIWFKDFGASRDLNKSSGVWAVDGERLPFDVRATELLHFVNKKDPDTPYGLPRWISNSPSVVGSRKAEEFNLQFFDAGGIPPLMIIVQGGKMAENAEQALREHFMAMGESRHQAVIMEAFATTGSLEDSGQNVKVTVERFGAERQKDSMFETYISNCDRRVQRAFRMPGIFLGMEDSITFATAFASYTVAEAQVFGPERDEFDETINLKIMPELEDGEEFEYRSKVLPVKDVNQQLEALGLVKESIERDSFVDSVAEITSLNLKAKDEDDDDDEEDALFSPLAPVPGVEPDNERVPGRQGEPVASRVEPTPTPPPVAKFGAEEIGRLKILAKNAAECMRRGSIDPENAEEFAAVMAEVRALSEGEALAFKALLAAETFPAYAFDPAGGAELSGCMLATIAAQVEKAAE